MSNTGMKLEKQKKKGAGSYIPAEQTHRVGLKIYLSCYLHYPKETTIGNKQFTNQRF